MTAPLPKYRCRYALTPTAFVKDWRELHDVSAARAAAQLLRSVDALGKVILPQTVYVQVETPKGEVLNLIGTAGLDWNVTAPPSRTQREWNQKGEQPL